MVAVNLVFQDLDNCSIDCLLVIHDESSHTTKNTGRQINHSAYALPMRISLLTNPWTNIESLVIFMSLFVFFCSIGLHFTFLV